MGILGFYLINLFGNITTTNQQDYTLLKNTVEASMYDSIDIASYRAGFYLCPKIEKNSEGKYKFSSKEEYNLVLKTENLNYETVSNCDLLVGEIKLNKEVFTESFLRRYAENINNNKNYQVTIQEVIEYPPKVSVRIDTFDTYSAGGSREESFTPGDFNIRNQIDAIFEEKIKEERGEI